MARSEATLGCQHLLGCRMHIVVDRLVARWSGLGHSRSSALGKIEGNDIPNARMVLENSLPADIII